MLALLAGILAIAVGLVFVAAIAAAVGLFLLIRWARRRWRPTQDRAGTRPRQVPAAGGVIDVSATEVREIPRALNE